MRKSNELPRSGAQGSNRTVLIPVILSLAVFTVSGGVAVAGTKPSAPPAKSAPAAPRPAAPAAPVRPGAPGTAATRPGAPSVPGTRPQPGLPGGPARPTVGTAPVRPVAPTPHPPMVSKTGQPVVHANDKVTPGPHGGKTIESTDGTRVQTNAGGKVTSIKTASGTEAHLNPATGKISSIRHIGPDGTGTIVHKSPSGVPTTEHIKKDPFAPGHTVRTVTHGSTNYRERDLLRRPGYSQRTYYDHGRTYVRVYNQHVYGVYGAYPVYVPAYYYGPGYYGYFGSPWGVQVAFGWGAYPGYAYYGGYFAPAPYYVSPGAWMADYIIAENLKASYADQQTAPPADAEAQTAPPEPIPAEVRTAYVQQVQAAVQQVAAEAAGHAAPDQVPGALRLDFVMFQSYTDVEADNNGEACALTGGDFVKREESTPDAAQTVAVTVVTVAKPSASHCAKNARVRLTVATLQDWYNSFQASQQAGFDALAANAGKNGFPAAPDTAKVANPNGQGTPDDPNALAGSVQEAQNNGAQMQAEVQPGGGQ